MTTQTTEETVKMAIEAELNLYVHDLTEKQYIQVIETFAKLVADKATAREREACAKLCEWYSVSKRANINYSEECAQAIRARGGEIHERS